MKPRTYFHLRPGFPWGIPLILIALLAALLPARSPVEAFALLVQATQTPGSGFDVFLPVILSRGGSASTPIPTATTPAPTVTTPAPTATTPAPTATTPAPTTTTPAPTATTPAPTATTPAPGSPTGFFLPWILQGEAQATDGPSLAVDANGGIHVAYTAYTSDADGNRPAYYTYCPGNCTSQASFSDPVIFNGKIDHVNLALDPQGRPRIMWVGIDPLAEKLSAYVYLSCDSGCTNLANWQSARIVALDNTLPHNSRFFALDPQGRPGLIFYLGWSGASNGTYFVHCQSGCLNPANWQHALVSPAELEFPVLVFDHAGLPRVAGSYLDTSSDPALGFLVYLECDANCQNITQGAAFPIHTCALCDMPKGYLDLAFDSLNHPRLTLYTGPIDPGRGLNADTLYYIYCNANCGDFNASVWDGYSLGLAAGVGTYARLVIDAQNRPRLVYEDVSYGLQYAWCQAGCETASPTWQTLLADSSADLDQTEPVPPIPPCQVAGWFSGKRPSLALDPSGSPRIAYDAEHWQGLEPVNNPPGNPGCPGFRMDQINARFTLFNQP